MKSKAKTVSGDGEKFWQLIEPAGRVSIIFLYLMLISAAVFFALHNWMQYKIEIFSAATILYFSAMFSIVNWRIHRTSLRAIFLLRNFIFIYLGLVLVWSAWSINISYPGNAQYKSLSPVFIVIVLVTSCLSVLLWFKKWSYGNYIFSELQKYLPSGKVPDSELYTLLTNKGKWNQKKMSLWRKVAYLATVLLGVILGKYSMGLLMLVLMVLLNAMMIGIAGSRMLLQYVYLQGKDLEVVRTSDD